MSSRNLFICIALVLAMAGVTWWYFGLGPLVVVLALTALVCPAIVIWVMRKQREVDRLRETLRAGRTMKNDVQ